MNDAAYICENPDFAVLREGLDAINAHVVSLGGEIKTTPAFDPTKAGRSTTSEQGTRLPSLEQDEEAKYDPTKVTEMMEFMK